MVNGPFFMIPFFLLFFIFIIILIYYSTVKEREFTESAKLMIERYFPQLQTTIISEGGFLSNPEVSAISSDKDHPIHNLTLKYKVYGSGKHRNQDLLLSSFISDKSQRSEFSAIIKKEGFFQRVFGGENVQLGHRSLDDRLLIHGSNPDLVQSYLSEDNFQIASKIANISDLKECKLEHYGDSLSVVIRSDHTNIRYVNGLLGLISALAKIDSRYPQQDGRSDFRTTTRKIIQKIPERKQRFKDHPIKIATVWSQTPVPESSQEKTQDTLFEEIKEQILDKSYLASDHRISETSAELKFNIGYFQTVNFKWDRTTITVSGVKEISLIPFQISMKQISRKNHELSFTDPFEGIEIKTDPNEIVKSLKDRTEIARTIHRLSGDLVSTIEIISDRKTISFLIVAPSKPENIDPLYDLTQNIGWFLEFSFL